MEKSPRRQSDAIKLVSFAKITRPALGAALRRVRLFRQLDRERKHPLVWVSGPGGAGKTTLVASYLESCGLPSVWYRLDAGDNDVASFFYYLGLAAKSVAPRCRRLLPFLTPEYVVGLQTFSANYFREFYRRLPNPSVLVLDNYHEGKSDGLLQNVVRSAIEQLPKGITVIAISREEPPSVLAELSASQQMGTIDWESLRLTEDESAAIAKLRLGQAQLPHAMLELHRKTQGWVAGLVLLTEHGNETGLSTASSDLLATQPIFDYFAAEIFRRGTANVQSFLLKTAFIPRISENMATALTDESDCAAILAHLLRRNYFTVRHPDGTYEYHPLFRAFLTSRAVELLSAREIDEVRRRSAQLLVAQFEIELAIDLLQDAQDWLAAAELIVRHASDFVAQGRNQTLAIWLRKQPSAMREKNPWISYWLGVCCLASAPATACGHFEQAFIQFEKQNDVDPLYLTWSGILSSRMYDSNGWHSMGKWVALYPSLTAGRMPPARKVEIKALFSYIAGLRRCEPDHPDLPMYIRRAEQLFQEETDLDDKFVYAATLTACHLWMGDIKRASILLEALQADAHAPNVKALSRLYWYLCNVIYAGGIGQGTAALRAVTEALALSRESGIRLLDSQIYSYGIYGQLAVGDVTSARQLIDGLSLTLRRAGKFGEAVFYGNTAMVYIHQGEFQRAVGEALQSLKVARAICHRTTELSALISLVYAYSCLGNFERAKQVLAETRLVVASARSKLFSAFCSFAEANMCRLIGQPQACIVALGEALRLASEMGHVTCGACPRAHAAELYAIALENDIYLDYVHEVIACTHLDPPSSVAPVDWPWPIRIYSLGDFAVEKDGAPLSLEGRMQRKPLELLQMLVAFGGRNVSVAKLSQVLWADAEGDMAHKALRTTLHRLRRMLGEQMIIMNEGQLSLNPAVCWLDVRAFERYVDEVTTGGATEMLAGKLLECYRGGFLEGNNSWPAVIERERLRAKFLLAVNRVQQSLQAEGNLEAAAAFCKKIAAVESLSEDNCRRLVQRNCEPRLRKKVLVGDRRRAAPVTISTAMPARSEQRSGVFPVQILDTLQRPRSDGGDRRLRESFLDVPKSLRREE